MGKGASQTPALVGWKTAVPVGACPDVYRRQDGGRGGAGGTCTAAILAAGGGGLARAASVWLRENVSGKEGKEAGSWLGLSWEVRYRALALGLMRIYQLYAALEQMRRREGAVEDLRAAAARVRRRATETTAVA